MAAYVPSQSEAFASVLYLRRQGGLLGLLRDVHAHAATIVVAASGLYLLVTYLAGAPPRERRAWWASAVSFLLVLFGCFTGFLLPMDQNAYWGSVVRLGIVETVPIVGRPLADLLRGGEAWNASTLTRFYALHAGLLPWLLLAPLSLLGAELVRCQTREALRRRLSLALLIVVAVYAFAAAVPARLEPEAAPGDAEYVPRPEWYFLWLFQLGRYVEQLPWLRSLLVPAALLGALAAAPLLKPLGVQARGAVSALLLLGFLGLTALARWDDRGLPPKPSYEQALATRADHLYKEECSSCHGALGKGDGTQAKAFGLRPRDFTAPGFWREATDAKMEEAVRDGKGEDMPAFAKKLSALEIEAVVALVRTRFEPTQ
jgi:ubiquinol-cytochrome c reductase cytochrome b subunit